MKLLDLLTDSYKEVHMTTGTLVALLVVALVACIILKVSKKIIGTIFFIAAIVLVMKYLVPMVM